MRYRWWVTIAVVLFAAGAGLGLSMSSGDGGSLSGELGALEELAGFITSLPAGAMFLFILAKNVTAVLFSFVMSPLLLAVPLFALVLNGWVIGVVAGNVIAEQSVGYLLRGLLPHGIIELPAFFMGQAAALSFGVAAMRAVFIPEKRGQLMPTLRSTLRYLVIALALLVPAAAIEAFITPRFLE